MYKDALTTLERKFGQPQNVITAHLDKFSSFSQLRMHNSENIISFSMTISSLMAIFRSLDYEEDLKSVSLCKHARHLQSILWIHPHVIVSQPPANLICRNQNLLSHNVYSNPASVNNPFSGHSAVISQPNLPVMSQWTPAVTQCITGVTSDGNTNPSVCVFSSETPISQQQFPHVSSGGTVYYGFPNHDASAENT